MIRDALEQPVDTGFVHHGTDIETEWTGDVPYLTDNHRFFVRNHTRPAVVDADHWRLLVTGDGVLRDTSYTLAELKSFSRRTIECVLECTGNGRRLFAEQEGAPRPGTPWGLGAVGLARWTGIPLSTLLHHAGLLDGAQQVMAVGLDESYVVDGVDHGRVRRPIPVSKAVDDVLVAWEMNGEPLPRDHGYPARLIVPGWVGIASIKWLGELRVTRTRVDSPWNTRWYRMHGQDWNEQNSALERMPVKSTLDSRDRPHGGHPTVLRGRAWSGEASVRMVEVSADAGNSWQEAALTGPNLVSGWVAWELLWTPPAAGNYEVCVRATDSDGRIQPETADDNDDGYLFGAAVRYSVTVDP